MNTPAWSIINTTAFAATAGAKTVLNAIAPAGFGLQVVEFEISFDGVTATAVPATVDLCYSTQATAGTPGSSPTPTLVRGQLGGGSAPTAGVSYSAEPTVLTLLKQWYVPQYMGSLTIQFPLGREPICSSSGGTDDAVALRVNVSANVNVRASMEVERS